MSHTPFMFRHDTQWHRQAIWQSVPAVVVALSVIALVVTGRQTPPHEVASLYEVAARQATLDEDWQSAELYFRKLTHLNEHNAWARFGLAISAEQQGNDARAFHLMQQIAPTDRTGYAAAHFWLARHLAALPRAESADVHQQRRSAIATHLQKTLAKQQDHWDAHLMLAQYYWDQRQLELAATHLSTAAKARPEVRIPTARLYVQLGKAGAARVLAEAAVEHYVAIAASNPKDVDARLQLARAQTFLEQFPQAASTLRVGLTTTRDGRFRDALGGLYVKWFDHTPPREMRTRLELLQRALIDAPRNPDVLNRFAIYASNEGGDAEHAIAILTQVLARGDAPATVHLILGMLYGTTGDEETSQLHLEQAYRAHPAMPAVANNLAWSLAHGDQRDLPRALTLVNAALKTVPDHPRMRDTRGTIFLKLGRPRQAITDLEAALHEMPDHMGIRERLALAYEAVGHSEMAQAQRDMLLRLQRKQVATLPPGASTGEAGQ